MSIQRATVPVKTRNVVRSIRIMEKATNLNMTHWQRPIDTECNKLVVAPTIDSFHHCGNTACFGGYIAASYAWYMVGGKQCRWDGSPIIRVAGDLLINDVAIHHWLGGTADFAAQLVYGVAPDVAVGLHGSEHSDFYGKLWCEVTAQDVIKKLETLLDRSFEGRIVDTVPFHFQSVPDTE